MVGPGTSTNAMNDPPSGASRTVADPVVQIRHPAGAVKVWPAVVVRGVSAASVSLTTTSGGATGGAIGGARGDGDGAGAALHATNTTTKIPRTRRRYHSLANAVSSALAGRARWSSGRGGGGTGGETCTLTVAAT